MAIHNEEGLFEVMVYSSADVDELARAVASRLGPHTRIQGTRWFWEYSSDAEPIVRVKVTALGRNHEHGRSAIRALYLPGWSRHDADLAASGCKR